MNNKVIIAFCIYAALFFAANIAYAHDKHDKDVYINNEQTTIVNSQKGVATAIAMAQIHFTLGENRLQGGIGFGSFNDSSAIALSIAKRKDNALYSLSIGSEGGNTSIAAGYTTVF